MIRALSLVIVLVSFASPNPGWNYVTSKWDQGQGFTFAYDPGFVTFSRRGTIRLSATPVENPMSWHGGGVYRNIQPYGHIEIMAKLPKGQGLWPALFLFDYDTQREIDIFEMIDPACQNLQFTVHDARNAAQINYEYAGTVDLSRAYHRYGLWWEPDRLIFYLDGQALWETNQYVPSEAMDLYLVLSAGGWAGNPDALTPNPAYFDIASVKVWH